jgi:hypothetical protein
LLNDVSRTPRGGSPFGCHGHKVGGPTPSSAKPFLAAAELDSVDGVWGIFSHRGHRPFHETTSGFGGDTEFIADLAVGPTASVVEAKPLLNRKAGT